MADPPDAALLSSAQLQDLLTSHGSKTTLPTQKAIDRSTSSIRRNLPQNGLGTELIAQHLLQDITPGLNGSSLSPNYYGFVTGGSTPIARFADQIVSVWDQNVSVHLPNESVASIVEDRALRMLCQLFHLPADTFKIRTFTTGATASNILGLASGRDYVLRWRFARAGKQYEPEKGLLHACLNAGIIGIRVLSTCPHSSLAKAASIVGLGSRSLVDVSTCFKINGGNIRFHMARLEDYLSEPGTVNIVVVSCSEVNLGGFATCCVEDMLELRRLCDLYGAWLHVDAAFGLFASILPDTPAFQTVRAGTAGMFLADSITSDGHKLLNVPYDTGLFFSRHPDITANVFSNPNAPYLRTICPDEITSPLNIGLENSRRWRALPVYANLLAYGRDGLSEMIVRMVELARSIARFINAECKELELYFPDGREETWASRDEYIEKHINRIFIIVAFRERDDHRNETLVQRIKDDRRIYVSGTVIAKKPVARIAVAKWDVDVQRDLEIVKSVLRHVTSQRVPSPVIEPEIKEEIKVEIKAEDN